MGKMTQGSKKTKLKWNGFQHFNSPLSFLLLLYARDSYERGNPKEKKLPAIRFNSNESLDKLDKELLNEPNIIKDNPIEVKRTQVDEVDTKRENEQKNVVQEKTEEVNLEEDFISSNDDWEKQSFFQEINSLNGLSTYASIQLRSQPMNEYEWASMIRSKMNELDDFVVHVEKLITSCLLEIQTDDVILDPIEEWISRDDANEAASSREINNSSHEISQSLLYELIDAVVKAEFEIDAKKKAKMDEHIHLQGKVDGHDDETNKQKSIQSTKKGKEIDDEPILVKIEKRKPMVDKGNIYLIQHLVTRCLGFVLNQYILLSTFMLES
ncbi:hypothetical protein E3N88_11921 [Mikania micrantha]|uniref:DUF4378 domain-containing protein n=1 Tax=Mikania micrantha TaxID=192012 RepID=A0A5N6P4D1_9ASTR|nr:hypothetical protein E3N88_11921 [Mikania micrantha]